MRRAGSTRPRSRTASGCCSTPRISGATTRWTRSSARRGSAASPSAAPAPPPAGGGRAYPPRAAAARDHAIGVGDVFRRGEFAGAVVDGATPLRPRLIWLQVGVVDEAACDRAAAAEIPCVMDRCLMVEHHLVQV